MKEAITLLEQARDSCTQNVYAKNKIEKAIKLIYESSTQNSNV